jgi:hypothetical protein
MSARVNHVRITKMLLSAAVGERAQQDEGTPARWLTRAHCSAAQHVPAREFGVSATAKLCGRNIGVTMSA